MVRVGLACTAARWRGRKRGVVSVELALTAPVLMLLLFGMLELGALVSDFVVLNAAARAGARSAAVGWPTSIIEERIASVASSLDKQRLTVTLQRRTLSDGMWTSWVALGDTNDGSGLVNDAPQGAEIRVQLSYRHELLAPGIFGVLADNPEVTYRTLQASAYMQRE